MFRFVVKHLRWLGRVPGLPQIFDAMLLAGSAAFHRERLSAMDAIETAALQLPGVRLRSHRLGGTEFTRAGRELGHLHGNGLLDLFVGRKQRDAIVANGQAQPHHVFHESGWISFWVRSPVDTPFARDLLAIAARVSD